MISVEDVKKYMDDQSISDDKIQYVLDGIVSFLENFTGLSFSLKTIVDEKYNGAGQKVLYLKNSGVTELTSIKYNSGTIGSPVRTPFDSDSYILDNDSVVLPDSYYPRGIQNISVSYKYGNEQVPKDIALVILKLCSKEINKSGAEGISSESVQGTSVSYSKEDLIDSEIESILGRYKKYYV